MLATRGIRVVGEAATGRDALRLVTESRADLVLLDMKLPDDDGLAVLRRLKEVAPNTRVLVVTMHDDPALVRRAIEAGAAGYLLKGASRAELLTAIRAVRDGEAALAQGLLQAAVGHAKAGEGHPPAGDLPTDEALLPVERAVLRLLAAGRTNKQIAAELRWSVGTVKKYIQRILEKLHASDRTQAAVTALRQGILR